MFGLLLPNPDFKQFLLAFYNSLTFLKAAYSESSKSLIVQNLKVTIVNKFFGTTGSSFSEDVFFYRHARKYEYEHAEK